jgi:predicted molibdopterin-dependent oxidoreductase YjgC
MGRDSEGHVSTERVTFTFDGVPMDARRGQTVAGALLAGGIVSWRVTRSGGRPRGLFCGIGACFDCLADVNDDRAVRACLIPVQDGDQVRTSAAVGGHEARPPKPAERPRGGQKA